MDTFGIIDTMLARPYLFTGGESLSALRYFLGGYNFCRMEKGEFDGSEARFSLLPLDWQLFWETIGGVFRKAENAAKEKKRQN